MISHLRILIRYLHLVAP
ncbi:hypothetical protein BAE44_0018379 [Dichanthelium oligosanthes]|uniref:Uncharacterized protein n=1 Tax=Dichanthelium oligosanthes TaxID=888268 RepID=A0A1E5V620_9POAL|nr:hypothetical protein BAE44_0018379 [Dichanthelium oligosanthes]